MSTDTANQVQNTMRTTTTRRWWHRPSVDVTHPR
jgi:hypothetical protein